MPLTNGAQREPSMEEILASIRRIIEDSDTGKAPGDADFTPRAPELKAVPDVEAFRAEFREAALSQQPESAGKVPTMAELKAQLGYESAYEAAPAPAHDPVSTPEPVVIAKAPEPTSMVSGTAAEYPRYNFDPTDDPDLDLDLDPVSRSVAITVTEQPVVVAQVKALEPVEAIAAPDSPLVKPAIISQHASRQVAAAFGELSDAFAARSKKTFDDLAEEMMRPMLQDWLDNNLPVLVERLVREEIERVARGAQ